MKKIIPLALVLIFTVFMLAGCGGGGVTDELKQLEQKNIKLVEVYNEVAELAVANGWDADELTVKELHAANAAIQTFNSIIKDPASAEGADMPELLSATDDFIKELDTNIRAKVSAPFAGK